MATSYSPKIPIDGLTLLLDSTNLKSYPGSGNTWYDISGKGNHGTLTNFTGPGAGTTSGFDTNTKYMMFDRHVGGSDGTANNFVAMPNSNSLDACIPQNGMTFSIWIKITSYTCTALTRWAGSWEIYYCSGLVWRTMGTGGNDGNSGLSYATHQNKFHNIIATHDGSTRKFYINGVEIYSNSNSVSGQDTTNAFGIGAYYGGSYAMIGALPVYALYNRAVSPAEASQIFEAHRAKFGL